MIWIQTNIQWVLIVSGVLTFSVIAYAIMPRAINRFVLGEEISDNLLAYRSWGVMIAASGLMLIYAASHPDVRLPILLYSITGKSTFVLPVFANPGRYARRPAFIAAIGDLVMMVLFAWYLLS